VEREGRRRGGLRLPGRARRGRQPGAGPGEPGATPPAAGAAFEIRRARPGDLDTLVELYAGVAAEGRWIAAEAPVDRAMRRRRMSELLDRPDGAMFVAEAEGELVGQLGMELARHGVADLGMLVAAGWRGRGVGSALVAAGLAWAREAGAHKVALQVWPHNQAAVALYEKFGFQREGLLRRHYRRRNGELWDAVVMGLLLDGPMQAGEDR
jgi:RimJ/RimL family protein N-acetyltransferase